MDKWKESERGQHLTLRFRRRCSVNSLPQILQGNRSTLEDVPGSEWVCGWIDRSIERWVGG